MVIVNSVTNCTVGEAHEVPDTSSYIIVSQIEGHELKPPLPSMFSVDGYD